MENQSVTGTTIERRRLIALGESLLVTLIWASTFVVVKIGLETLGPLTIAGLRYFLGAVVLLPFLIKRQSLKTPISKELWLHLILIGVSAYTIGNGALFWGLKYVPATTGSLLMGLIPLLVLAGGALLLREIPTRWQIFGVFLSLFGSVLFFFFRNAARRTQRYFNCRCRIDRFFSIQFIGSRNCPGWKTGYIDINNPPPCDWGDSQHAAGAYRGRDPSIYTEINSNCSLSGSGEYKFGISAV
ncbi:MAG: DMT family transporter [Anaerolineales bacterium]|nr:DMT family transporter [Anaerolineales bacterium]